MRLQCATHSLILIQLRDLRTGVNTTELRSFKSGTYKKFIISKSNVLPQKHELALFMQSQFSQKNCLSK